MSGYQVLEYFNKATRSHLTQPDWDAIIEVVDCLNDNEHAITTIVPRMSENLKDKNPRVVWLTLIVIDSCVKNCDNEDFIFAIANKEFMKPIKKIVYKRYVHRKKDGKRDAKYKNLCGETAAKMIQAWGIAFHEPKLRRKFPIFYNTLKHCVNSKGVRFPNDNTTYIIASQQSESEKKKNTENNTEKRRPGGQMLRDSLRSTPVPNHIQSLLQETKVSAGLLQDIIDQEGNVEGNPLAQDIMNILKEKQELIQNQVAQNIENERVLNQLLTTFDDVENVMAQANGQDPSSETETTDSSSSHEISKYQATNDSFFNDFMSQRNTNVRSDPFSVPVNQLSNNPFDSLQPTNTSSTNPFEYSSNIQSSPFGSMPGNNPSYGNNQNNSPFGSMPGNNPSYGNNQNNSPFGSIPGNSPSYGNTQNNSSFGSMPGNNPSHGNTQNNSSFNPFGNSGQQSNQSFDPFNSQPKTQNTGNSKTDYNNPFL
eukprot:TRINITY_DN593_c0_g1_i2.p1 TRINITY_DN593_c0_g1~~TRINITY_DN593_c0_g1_i2.p1  ORF type:complete len:481 (-),score=96.90 TRINITY_DN593_c0_g1_i2:38-1480(-)